MVIAQEAELVHRKQTASTARVPGDKDQVPFLYAHRRPLQVIVDFGRLAVLVRAEERNIEIVTRIFKVVGVATEERHIEFRCEDQPNVVVLLVFVEVVHGSRIQGDDIAPHAID